MAADRGDIVMGWLVKITVVLAVLGIVAFDGISILTARLSVEDQSAQAARSASETWDRTHDIKASLASAAAVATAANPLNEIDPNTFRVDPDGTAHVTLTRVAPTIVAGHLGPLKSFCHVDGVGQGRSNA